MLTQMGTAITWSFIQRVAYINPFILNVLKGILALGVEPDGIAIWYVSHIHPPSKGLELIFQICNDYCNFKKFRENFIVENSIKRHNCHINKFATRA